MRESERAHIKSHIYPNPLSVTPWPSINSHALTTAAAGESQYVRRKEKASEVRGRLKRNNSWERRFKYQHALECCSTSLLVCCTYSIPILTYFPRLCINGKFAWEPADVWHTSAEHYVFCWLLQHLLWSECSLVKQSVQWGYPLHKENQFWNSLKANKCQRYKSYKRSGGWCRQLENSQCQDVLFYLQW